MFLCFSPISCAGSGRGDLGCGRGLFEFLCLEPCGHAGEFVCLFRGLSLLTVWREGVGYIKVELVNWTEGNSSAAKARQQT